MEYSSEIKIYRRRKPQETSLWKLLDHHFLELEERYEDLYQQQDGFYRPVTSHVVRKYLECGDLRQGFGDYARWHPHLHALVVDGLFWRAVIFCHAEGRSSSDGRAFPCSCTHDVEEGRADR